MGVWDARYNIVDIEMGIGWLKDNKIIILHGLSCFACLPSVKSYMTSMKYSQGLSKAC